MLLLRPSQTSTTRLSQTQASSTAGCCQSTAAIWTSQTTFSRLHGIINQRQHQPLSAGLGRYPAYCPGPRHLQQDTTTGQGHLSITFGNSERAKAEGSGTVRLCTVCGSDSGDISLTDVLYVPSSAANLLSIPRVVSRGITYTFASGATLPDSTPEADSSFPTGREMAKTSAVPSRAAPAQQDSNIAAPPSDSSPEIDCSLPTDQASAETSGAPLSAVPAQPDGAPSATPSGSAQQTTCSHPASQNTSQPSAVPSAEPSAPNARRRSQREHVAQCWQQ